jgi:dipeptidyl aminopeptidase/acylaminoacyl peptidase
MSRASRLTKTLSPFALLLANYCGAQDKSITAKPDYRPRVEVQHTDFAVARANFKTQLRRFGPAPIQWEDVATPPGFSEITYASGDLRLKAWLSLPADSPKKHPAILYLHFGFDFSHENFDLVRPFRDAGYVVLLPTTRGENGQHGVFTMYYDEVSDVINAADYLRGLPQVDPNRLFVTGYSVGGTLTMLASELYPHFRAAASISGTPDVATYLKYAGRAPYNAPFDPADPKEALIRSPLAWAESLKCPIRMYYGTTEDYFAIATPAMASAARAKGIDAEALTVKGDHDDIGGASIALALQFFQEFK